MHRQTRDTSQPSDGQHAADMAIFPAITGSSEFFE
jgi:hypothetical protein